jgi:hypothetical protein
MLHCFIKTVRNAARNLARTERRKSRREENYAKSASVATSVSGGAVEGEELALAARNALSSLPEEEREAVGLCCEQGFTRESAAKILGIPKRTLTDRVNRGLEKLRKILAQQGYSVTTLPAVGAALSSIPLPPAPPGLLATMQKLAANPSLANGQAGGISAQTLSTASTKKVAVVWLAAGLAVTVAAVASGLWLWNEAQQETVVKWAEETGKTKEAKGTKQQPEPNFVTVYDDRFDGERLADFWETAEPAALLKVNSPEHPSSLVLSGYGKEADRKTRRNSAAEAKLTSRAVALQDNVLAFMMYAVKSKEIKTVVGDMPSKSVDQVGFDIMNVDGRPLLVRPIDEKSANVAADQESPESESKHIFYGKEKVEDALVYFVCIYPSGEMMMIKDYYNMFRGKMEEMPASVRIQLSLETSHEALGSTWKIKRVAVRRFDTLPVENAKTLLKEMLAESKAEVERAVVK